MILYISLFSQYSFTGFFLCVFGGVLKQGNQEKKEQTIRNKLHNVYLINHLLSCTACS